MSGHGPLPIALTMGEPAGIGGELALKAWAALRESGQAFYVIDDPQRLAEHAATLGVETPLATIDDPSETAAIFRDFLPILPVGMRVMAEPGRPDAANAKSVVRAIEMAVEAAKRGSAAAVVTNPIQKSTLYSAGFPFPGHTEFLGELAGAGGPAVMMLACPELRVVPVTVHVSLREALGRLTTGLIVSHAQVAHVALCRDFGIAAPRIAVAGLNPHAGEDGAMGDEEIRIIQPAIDALRKLGIDARGPYPPDTMFAARVRKSFDVAVCMYHDQALIPLKALDMDGGVNVTLGLTIVRTSPDHGTALNIAGKGIAEPGSMIAAIRMAAQMTAGRGSS